MRRWNRRGDRRREDRRGGRRRGDRRDRRRGVLLQFVMSRVVVT
jgi:hypothetical protein